VRGEPFALTRDSCGEPMLPNLSQGDADGCLWICIDPDCPELCAAELETEDLVEGGVPKALAARVVRLVDYYEDIIRDLREVCIGEGEGEEGAAAPPLNGIAVETPDEFLARVCVTTRARSKRRLHDRSRAASHRR